jgi:hypothetical protein
VPALRNLTNVFLASRRSITSESQSSPELPCAASMQSAFVAVNCGRSVSAAPRGCRSGFTANGGAGPVPSLTGEGDGSPAATWCSSAAASFCRRFLAALASGSPSLLTAADLSFGTLVSRAPMLLAVSMGQGSLVSRLPAASGAASGSEALVPAPWKLRCSPALWPAVRLHSCSPSLPYCTSLSCCRRVSLPSYPWTLELRPHRTQLAWNAPGLASPSSLVETGDQSDLKRLTPALQLHSYAPPSGML